MFLRVGDFAEAVAGGDDGIGFHEVLLVLDHALDLLVAFVDLIAPFGCFICDGVSGHVADEFGNGVGQGVASYFVTRHFCSSALDSHLAFGVVELDFDRALHVPFLCFRGGDVIHGWGSGAGVSVRLWRRHMVLKAFSRRRRKLTGSRRVRRHASDSVM